VVDVGLVAIEVVAAITLVVAVLVLYLDFGRVHRAFALFLVLRALMDGMLLISQEYGDLGLRLRMYWFIAVPFAALHFCLAYRRRHGRRQETRPAWLVPIAILAVALVFEAVYFFDHSLFDAPPDAGPFESFQSIRFLAYAAVAWVFASELAKTQTLHGRRALLLASIGFALTPLYFCTFELGYALVRDRFTWGLAEVYFAASLLLLADTFRRLLAAAGSRLAIIALVVGCLALAGATMAVGVNKTSSGETMLRIITAVTALAVPLCITYALVKHRLFDAEVKLRFAVKGTTLTGSFLAVFIVFQQLIQAVSNEFFGAIGGAVAAGLLLFALTPLQRWADRVSYRAVPGSAKRGSHAERLHIYREQLEVAWADGRLTAKERLLFSNLQERLGLSAEEAARLESEVLAGRDRGLAATPRRSAKVQRGEGI
jgi:hypothetical protein